MRMTIGAYTDTVSAAHAAWKRSHSDLDLSALLNALSAPIGGAVNTYRAAPLPGLTMNMEARRLAVEAIKSFDDARGASLSTHVGNYVRNKMFRYVSTYQNPARIPEEMVRHVGGIGRADEELAERLGRAPTSAEVADHMGVSLSMVTRLRKNIRTAILESSDTGDDVHAFEHDPAFERIMLAYYSLTDLEKQVFDYSLGAHGRKKLDAGAIAREMKLTPSRVSNLKAALAKKLEPYLVGT